MRELWRRLSSWFGTPVGRGVLVTAGYTAATVVLTWPILAHISQRLGGDYGDGFMFTWNLWFFKESVINFQNPFFTDLIYFPGGADLRLHSMSWASCILALPLQIFFEPLTTYNLLLLFYYVHAGVCMYALCRELGASPVAAFFGGWLFTFSPFHHGHSLGHLNLMGTGWVPLHLLFVVRTLRTGAWKEAVKAGLVFVVAALTCWYFATMCMVATAVLFAWRVLTDRSSRKLRTLYNLLIISAAALLLLPFMWPILTTFAEGQIFGSHPVDYFGADLYSLVLPNQRMALANWFSNPMVKISPNWAETTNYLGFFALGLTVVAVVRAKDRDLRGCLLAGAVALILSLGTVLRVNGRPIPWFELPYLPLYDALPMFRIGSVPSRFSLLVVLSLAAGAAAGIHYLSGLSLRAKALAVGLGVVAALEYLPRMPHPTASLPPPPIMRKWSKMPERFAVLDLNIRAHQNWHQMTHRKPLVQGYSARTTAKNVWGLFWDRVVGPLKVEHLRDRFPVYGEALSILERRKIRFIILGLERPWRRVVMERYLNFRRVFANRRMSIHRVERRVELVSGFSSPRIAGNRVTWWSLGSRSVVRFTLKKKPRGGLKLAVGVAPYERGRTSTFTVTVNGTPVGTVRLDSRKWTRQTIVLPERALTAGSNRVDFLYAAPTSWTTVDFMGRLVATHPPAAVFDRVEIRTP